MGSARRPLPFLVDDGALEDVKRLYDSGELVYVPFNVLSDGTPVEAVLPLRSRFPPAPAGDVAGTRHCSCSDSCTLGCPCSGSEREGRRTVAGRLSCLASAGRESPAETLPLCIFECNDDCRCRPELCRNRVVQGGFNRDSLQVFRHPGKGFAVRARGSGIPKGSFVCEYAGEVIKTDEANARWRTRLKMMSEHGVSSNAGGSFMAAGNYIFCLREHMPDGTIYRTNIDPTKQGNIGRFIAHSCDPNLEIVPTRVNSIVPRAALFAIRDIRAGEELAFDYSGGSSGGTLKRQLGPSSSAEMPDVAPNSPATSLTKCLCGSTKCRGWLPFDSTL